MTRLAFAPRFLLVALLALTALPALRAQGLQTEERRALLTVRLHPEAKLTVDGNPTRQTGATRRFYSPPLEPGKNYHYTFVAEWMPNSYETYTVTRKVKVEPGKPVEVDMRKVDPKQGDTLVIIFVETPQKIVDAMMKLAKVGKDDVVYDLGCGDGRIVITAVKKFNAKRGVGVDREPQRIKESKENAKKAGVEDKVEFRQQDVFKVNVSEATVVTLYLSDDLNKLLLPKLREQLKPGARIVSHRFTMGDWKPDKTETVDIEHDIPEEKLIHLWTIEKK